MKYLAQIVLSGNAHTILIRFTHLFVIASLKEARQSRTAAWITTSPMVPRDDGSYGKTI